MRQHNERIVIVDVLRVLAILGVVLVHTTTRVFEATNYQLTQTPLTLLFNMAARFCVPLFFLISGFALEYRYREGVPLTSFYKRRVERIFSPYLFWSTLYFLFHVPSTPHTNILIYLQSLLLGVSEYHLYFIPAIILFYLIFPLLHKNKNILFHPAGFTILLVLQLFFLSYDFYVAELPLYLPIRVFLLTFLAFIFGMFSAHHMDRLQTFCRKTRFVFFLLTIGSYVWLVFETITLYPKERNIHYLYSQWRVSSYLYMFGLAALLFPAIMKQQLWSLIHFLSRNSFFVFFVHIFVLYGVWSVLGSLFLTLPQVAIKSGFTDICLFLLVAGISYTLAYMINGVPKAKLLLGVG